MLLGGISAQASQLDLSNAELNYIKLNPVIKVHAEKAWRPFNFIENKEVKGYSNELMRLAGKMSVYK